MCYAMTLVSENTLAFFLAQIEPKLSKLTLFSPSTKTIKSAHNAKISEVTDQKFPWAVIL